MKKLVIILLAFALSVSLLSGCSKKDENVLRFATWDSEEALETQKKIAARFEELNPGVTVQVEAYGDGYDQKIAAGFGAKNAPDVMYMWDFPTYKASLQPLNEYMNNDEAYTNILKDLYPGLLNYSTIEGETFGLPVGYTSHVIYYNKTLFDQAGIEYPQSDWTWQDLREKAMAISNLGEDIYGYAVSTEPDPYDFEQFLWTNGSAYLAPDGSKAEGYLNSKQTVQMMQFFADMISEGSAWGAQDSVSTAFRGGNVAMQESGIWPMGRHIEAIGEDNLGIVGLPNMSADKPAKSVINSSAICMAKDSEKKDLAWEFIKFYSSPEAVKMRAEIDLPVLTSVAEELGYTTDAFYAPFYEMLKTAEGNTPSFLLHEEYSKISENIAFAIEKTFVDTINGEPVKVQEIFDNAVSESEKFFK